MRRLNNLLVVLFILMGMGASALVWKEEGQHLQAAATQAPLQDTTRPVDLIYADKIRLETIDTTVDRQILVGKVHLKQEKTHFFGDSVIYNKKTKIVEAFGHVHINDADSIHTYADKLLYYVDTKKAILTNNAKLTDGKSTLTTNELHYDSNEKIGEYFNGGKVVNSKSVLTSKEATYYGDLKDVYFKKDVVLIDPAYQLRSDSLLYNTNSEVTTFITKTYIKDSSNREIETKEGFYDLKNKKAEFGKRPIMIDAKARTRTTADFVDINDSTGITTLTGRAVHVDSVQGVSVLANYMWVNKKDETFFATRNPLMIIKQDKDSIYVTADTLYSGRLSKLKVLARTDSASGKIDTIQGAITLHLQEKPKNDSADRYFQGYHHVRIFSDSLQAVSDSMFYSGADSVFQLFTDPVAWANNSQITGDTMYLYTKDKKPSRLYVFENGFAVNKVGKDMYNQLRGNRMNGYFVEGNIDYMRSKGNAESVFYVMDEDSALVGVNKAEGDIIDLRFLNKELNKVVIISEPKATMFPAKQTTEQDKLLRNFRWLEARRPKTRFELFGN